MFFRYSASSGVAFFRKPVFSRTISLRSAKKGKVSARSIISFGFVFFPSKKPPKY